MYPKALACGTDIVCVELEDGIAPKDKQQAREHALALFGTPQADDGVERIVRINCLRSAFGLADVQAVLDTLTPPPGLMLPKVMSPDEISWLDDLLTERGHDTRLHIIIETNAALESAHEIARASARIEALFFGGVDMAAELRCRNSWEPLLYARSRVVHAAAAAGIDVIDVPYLDKKLTAEQIKDKLDKMALDLDLPTNLFNAYMTSLEQGRCVLALTPLDPDENGNWQLPEQIRLIRPEYTERPVLDDNTGELIGVRIIGVRSQIRDNIIPSERFIYIMHGWNNELFSDIMVIPK